MQNYNFFYEIYPKSKFLYYFCTAFLNLVFNFMYRMKNKLLLFVVLFCICRFNAVSQGVRKDDDGTLTTKGLQIHFGLALPQGDFAKDQIPAADTAPLFQKNPGGKDLANGIGHATSSGWNLGLKYYAKLPVKNLFLAVGVDGYYNAISGEYKEYLELRAIEDMLKSTNNSKSDRTILLDENAAGAFGISHLNAAFVVGPCYRYSFSRAVAVFGEANLGVNMSMISDINMTKEGALTADKVYDKTLSHAAGYRFTYAITAGVLFVNTFSINFKYSGLGSYKYDSTVTGVVKTTEINKSFKTDALPISYFTIALGIKF
jgi:hypothetical protein